MEHIRPILIFLGWYLLAGLAAAIVGNRTRVEAWCLQNPKTALVLNLLRASGFDYIKAIASIASYAKGKTGLPPSLPTLLLCTLALGCSSSSAAPKPPSAAEIAEVCVTTVTLAPQVEKLAQQYAMTVPEFARQACGLASVPISRAVALGYAGATIESVR